MVSRTLWAAGLDSLQVGERGVGIAAKQAALDTGTSVIALTQADARAVNAVSPVGSRSRAMKGLNMYIVSHNRDLLNLCMISCVFNCMQKLLRYCQVHQLAIEALSGTAASRELSSSA